jgi:hypothetical protein
VYRPSSLSPWTTLRPRFTLASRGKAAGSVCSSARKKGWSPLKVVATSGRPLNAGPGWHEARLLGMTHACVRRYWTRRQADGRPPWAVSTSYGGWASVPLADRLQLLVGRAWSAVEDGPATPRFWGEFLALRKDITSLPVAALPKMASSRGHTCILRPLAASFARSSDTQNDLAFAY